MLILKHCLEDGLMLQINLIQIIQDPVIEKKLTKPVLVILPLIYNQMMNQNLFLVQTIQVQIKMIQKMNKYPKVKVKIIANKN